TSHSPNGFEPVFSQGLTGLRNLGNSGDMASTLQSICTLPAFRIYYPLSFPTQACTCTQQLLAPCIAWLNSGLSRFKSPLPPHPQYLPLMEPMPLTMIPRPSSTPLPVLQEPIKPTMFNSLIERVHEEFSMKKQKDSQEFFAYI
ncbi:hypothetical protein BU17DRAFT_29281, partial [Hysterangium stoloniferum]